MTFISFYRGLGTNTQKWSTTKCLRLLSRNTSHKAATPNSSQQKASSPLTTSYRKYAQQFKNKPGSYMTSFAILHEVTAIAPFPIIYLLLDNSSIKIPFPDTVISEGNRFVNKVRVHYGYEPLEPDNRTMIHLVTTYGIVKALLPVRIAASAAMTPFLAERFIGPIFNFVHKGILRNKNKLLK
ncbi:uncharacterized protein BX663DRAFT_436209 [Cokeromyces recurvatus]|uniref:uncharacterized protein n=1 Tax=Cokeromyces recurvatus TaxID=90255 RepID=UPI00221F451A|nr:uncharacterized protein BX663DRAFT_436209 [Cokeromyces recurvatus]KAI7902216.1 hypothetical protein BX663DRAFT_436209 [Cokeromyces recurvatus]